MNREKRTWSIEEKVFILKEIEKTGVVEGCRKHGIYAVSLRARTSCTVPVEVILLPEKKVWTERN